MNTGSLKTGFESIEDDLRPDEILALQKFTGLKGKKYIIESFFQELINCRANKKPFYSSGNWKSLTQTEKIVLSVKIHEWYNRLLFFYPDYQKRCTYTSEDDLKLKVVLNGENLSSKEEYKAYILYLESIKREKIDERGSAGFIKWIDKKICHAKSQIEMELSNGIDESYIFPDEIIDILAAYHRKFNGWIFYELPQIEFLNLFKEGNGCNIKFKPGLKGHFKFSISHIEKSHTLKSDFNRWFSKKINGPYKNSKGKPKRNSDITEEIRLFFKHQIKQSELKHNVRL